jgi:hypothetical protein
MLPSLRTSQWQTTTTTTTTPTTMKQTGKTGLESSMKIHGKDLDTCKMQPWIKQRDFLFNNCKTCIMEYLDPLTDLRQINVESYRVDVIVRLWCFV